jgi:hypothetical protein
MKSKFVIIGFLLLILCGVALGFWLWNKPPAKVESVSSLTISVEELCRLYSADEQAANARFLNQAIEVRGTITEVIHNLDDGLMVIMADKSSSSDLQCAFRDKNVTLKEGEKITIKGFCAGKTISGVALTDCILIP